MNTKWSVINGYLRNITLAGTPEERSRLPSIKVRSEWGGVSDGCSLNQSFGLRIWRLIKSDLDTADKKSWPLTFTSVESQTFSLLWVWRESDWIRLLSKFRTVCLGDIIIMTRQLGQKTNTTQLCGDINKQPKIWSKNDVKCVKTYTAVRNLCLLKVMFLALQSEWYNAVFSIFINIMRKIF